MSEEKQLQHLLTVKAEQDKSNGDVHLDIQIDESIGELIEPRQTGLIEAIIKQTVSELTQKAMKLQGNITAESSVEAPSVIQRAKY